LSHFRAWLRTSNVAASGFGFGRDCNGFTDYRHFNQNPCNSILSLYLSAFHFFVVTLLTQAWKVKQLDKPDKVKRQEIKEKDIKVYTLDSNLIGVPSIDRKDLANQIDKIPDLPEKERTRLKRDAMAVDINFEEIIDDTQEKTENYRG
jgi:hypothetical protein